MAPPLGYADHYLRALLALADPEYFLEVRCIDPAGRVVQDFMRVRDVLAWGLPARILAADGHANIYVGLAPRRHYKDAKTGELVLDGTRAACAPALAAQADFDSGYPPGPPAPPPSITVRTSDHKTQALWLLERPSPDFATIEAINRGIGARYGADAASVDIARVFRLPGFLNIKYAPPPRAALLLCEPSRRYSLDQLQAAFPSVASPSPKPSNRHHSAAPDYLSLVYDGIVGYLFARGMRYRRRGEGVFFQCPPEIHGGEDWEPSLSIDPVKGFICFGCGFKGRLTLLAHRLGINLLESEVAHV